MINPCIIPFYIIINFIYRLYNTRLFVSRLSKKNK
nr:MAG TPA: hypothetical protein [Caudoviricetes sp.]